MESYFPDELRIVLRQHTPLVVSEQDKDFFIRSTELRPKLNRFLINRYEESHKNKEEEKRKVPLTWLVGKGKAEHQALDFAVTDLPYGKGNFRNMESIPGTLINAPVLFRRLIGSDPFLKFTIQCPHGELFDFIKCHIEEFFILENFGKRQSKGYGQFSVARINSEERELPTLEEMLRLFTKGENTPEIIYYQEDRRVTPEKLIRYTYNKLKAGINYTQTIYLEEPFEKNQEEYLLKSKKGERLIRNGDNWLIKQTDGKIRELNGYVNLEKGYIFRTRYEKSLLWKYFQQKYKEAFPGWEKKAIKKALRAGQEKIFENVILRRPWTKPHQILENEYYEEPLQKDQAWFIRALLGLPQYYEFETWKNGKEQNDRYKPGNYERLCAADYGIPPPSEGYDKVRIQIKSKQRKIEQFPSPLQFKLFDNGAFMIPKSIPKQLLGAEFEYTAKITYEDDDKKDEDIQLSAKENGILKTQVPDSFDLYDFLDYQLRDESLCIHELLGWKKYSPANSHP